MTSTAAALRRQLDRLRAEVPGAPAAGIVVAPATVEEAAAVLDAGSEHRRRVLVWGGGTHQGYGHPVPEPDVVLSTHRLDRVVAWSAEDLTLVVEAGVRVADVEQRLAGAGQTAVLPEDLAPEATIGGVVAAGLSGWRRLRYGPTRDRVLEVVLATGDGRVVRAGGPVVKNVTGYDIPRLACGSLGSLGVIGRVALKLWPVGTATATVEVDDAERAHDVAVRPLAVLEVDGGAAVYVAGTAAEVEAQAAALGGDVRAGLRWPAPLDTAHVLVCRVPPRSTRAAADRVPVDWSYRAAFGVGEVRIGGDDADAGALSELRGWAESVGGALVVARAPARFSAELDPWGAPPPSAALQRRVKAAFDPLGVCNPGRLPGRI